MPEMDRFLFVAIHKVPYLSIQHSAEDEELQRRFMSIVRSYPEVIPLEPGRDEYVRIGTHFLRTHQDWLEQSSQLSPFCPLLPVRPTYDTPAEERQRKQRRIEGETSQEEREILERLIQEYEEVARVASMIRV